MGIAKENVLLNNYDVVKRPRSTKLRNNLSKLIIGIFSFLLFFSTTFEAHAATLAQTLSGRILLDVQNHGEAWYVHTVTKLRYYMKDGPVAYNMMRNFGLGITDADLAIVPSVKTIDELKNSTAVCLSNSTANRLKGKILLQVQQHGEAWYVDVVKCRRIYMKDGDAAYSLMRFLGLGITSKDLATIPIGATSTIPVTSPVVTASQDPFSSVQTYDMVLDRGTFPVTVISLQKDKYEMLTVSENSADCFNNCPAKKLDQYVTEAGALIGIHGSYFCPPDYATCANQLYSYIGPFFNTTKNVAINDYKVPFHSGPMLMIDTADQWHYLHRTNELGWNFAEYNSKHTDKVKSAISNYPSLIENGVVVVESGETMDDKQRTLKGYRGAIGYTDSTVYLVVSQTATVIDMAYVMQKLGATYALNLDGGGSTALYYQDHYIFGPGRLLPNAIVFKKK